MTVPRWRDGYERFFRQTGRTTRRLVGALAFARAGRCVAFLFSSRGLPLDTVMVRDHTCGASET